MASGSAGGPSPTPRTRGRSYLLAWDLDRADWRTFRLDRVSDPTPTGVPFAPRELPAESAAAYLDVR